jgi:hypothetical protein
MTNDERMQRESSLIATIRRKLPDFAKACAVDAELVLLHQDAFAADYQEDEYTLLGMAIKYAGRAKQKQPRGHDPVNTTSQRLLEDRQVLEQQKRRGAQHASHGMQSPPVGE